MKFTVRPAQECDAKQIAELLVEILKLHADNRPDIFRNCGAKYNAEQVSEMMKDSEKRLWVSVKDSTVLGYAICKIMKYGDPPMRERTCLWIDDLCIHPDCRRMGIGEALINTAVEFAKEQRYAAAELNVWSFNEKAIAFYDKQGFKPQRTVMELPLNGETK